MKNALRHTLLAGATACLAACAALAQDDAENGDTAAPVGVATDAGAEIGADPNVTYGTDNIGADELDEAEEVDQPESDAAGAPAAQQGAAEDDQSTIARINAYLNGLDTAHANFIQIGPDGAVSEGELYISRPGRARFEYAPPHPSIIVANRGEVAHQDRDLETIDRVPLRSTPLRYLLQRNVDIADDADIVAVERRAGEIAVTARDPDGEMEGELTLVFTAPTLELREWIVLDALGQSTVITLTNLTRGGSFDSDLFELEEERRPSRRRDR